MRVYCTILASMLSFGGATPGQAQAVRGHCSFNTTTLAFAGTATEQALCLLTPVLKWGKLGPRQTALPPTLAAHVGRTDIVPLPALTRYVTAQGIAVGNLAGPVSRARGGASGAPLAHYFVIHDTSSPWLGNGAFPTDIDTAQSINRLGGFLGASAVAHFFVNRSGTVAMGHDFSVPWRATKFESQTIGLPAKGLFLHVENVQPRRRDPSGGAKNDAIAPVPGLTPRQYDRLALLYIVASTRAGQWLIPAYHTVLDQGISDGHDDPQNFDLAAFDSALAAHVAAVEAQR